MTKTGAIDVTKERIRNRTSNMELLRILATLLILFVHATYFAQGIPLLEDFISRPQHSTWLVISQSFSIVCVNLFVLISGWFGIRPSVKSFGGFVFQCLFYSFLIYGVCLAVGHADFSIKAFIRLFYLTKLNWFLKAYVGLYILSPILNIFIEKASEKSFRLVLIFFFVFQTIYGCIESAFFFEQGYSTHSFIGLYLLARYVRIYSPSFSKFPKWLDLLLYVAISLSVAIVIIFIAFFANNYDSHLFEVIYHHQYKILSYIAPSTILASLFLLLFFSKLSIQSRFINLSAASSFSAYLTHANFYLTGFYVMAVNYFYDNFPLYQAILLTLSLIIGIYFVSTIVDQLRIFIWGLISPYLIKRA